MILRRCPWLVVAFSLAAAPLGAGTITFEPEQPTSEDVLRVIYHEENWFLACEPTLQSVAVQNDQIVLTAGPPDACILILTHNPYTFTVDVGPLPAATYTVVVETIDGAYQRVTESSEVTIFPAGGRPEPVPASLGCVHGSRPGATLLLPYFEVDLEDPAGRDTFFSVNNASGDAALAHVVAWTNWGIPVLSFDLAIEGNGVRSIRLRDIFVDGKIPVTSLPPEDQALFSGCASPVTIPVLGESALRQLRDRLTGQPDPPVICYSSAVEDGTVATGFVTADAVNRCSGSQLSHPLDDGYFIDGGEGVASNANVLWGDSYLIDASQDFAQGLELVSIVADAERFGAESETFYNHIESNRAPLGHRYRTRYLQGGAFSGGTDLLAWTSSFTTLARNCDSPVGDLQFAATFRKETGALDSEFELFHLKRAMRIRVGEASLPVGSSFGTVDVSFGTIGGLTEPFPVVQQGLIVPILSAEGRYSVGLNAFQLDGFCP